MLVHSLAGCRCYGAFVARMLSVRVNGLPAWSLPIVGGIVFTALVVAFLTSSVGMPSFDGVLSQEQIQQVVEYTRTELGG